MSSPKCSPSSTNIASLNRYIEEMRKSHGFINHKIQSQDEKIKIDPQHEKAVLAALFDSLGGSNEQIIDTRNIKLPILIDREINTYFKDKVRIIWYGSTSLSKENISDYDLMFIPDNYETESFKLEDMTNMYDFMNKLRNKLNDTVEAFDITKVLTEAKAEKISEVFDTFVKIDYNGNPFGSPSKTQSFEKYESDSKKGSFKLSIIPYLWINHESTKGGIDEDNGIVFCLFRIKYVFKLNGKIITIPVVDLSYHFCNRGNSLIESIRNWGDNYKQFNKIIYVKTSKNLRADLYLQLISEFNEEEIDRERVSRVSHRLGALGASSRKSLGASSRDLTGGKMKRTKKVKKLNIKKKSNKLKSKK